MTDNLNMEFEMIEPKIYQKDTFSDSTFSTYLVWTSEGWRVSEYSDLAEGDIYKPDDADPPSEDLQRLSKEIRPLSSEELHKVYKNFDNADEMVVYMRQFEGTWESADNPLNRRMGWENDSCDFNVGILLTTIRNHRWDWKQILKTPESRKSFGIACQDKSIDFPNWEIPPKDGA